MRARRLFIVAATVGALALTAGTAFAAGATTNGDGALARNPVDVMGAAMNGWQQAPMHGDGSAPMHPGGGMPMGDADHDAMHRDGDAHMDSADHDAMHAQMREHMPADLREDCDTHHAAHTRPDA